MLIFDDCDFIELAFLFSFQNGSLLIRKIFFYVCCKVILNLIEPHNLLYMMIKHANYV